MCQWGIHSLPKLQAGGIRDGVQHKLSAVTLPCCNGCVYVINMRCLPMLLQAGGWVTLDGRINAILDLSRAFGDFDFKQVRAPACMGASVRGESHASTWHTMGL